MKPFSQNRPSVVELTEVERLNAIITRLARHADSGPRSLAHAALATGLSTAHVH